MKESEAGRLGPGLKNKLYAVDSEAVEGDGKAPHFGWKRRVGTGTS